MNRSIFTLVAAAAVLAALSTVPTYAGKKSTTEVMSNVQKVRAEVGAQLARNIRG
jgi:pentose-5-phosphate-3-epimerase